MQATDPRWVLALRTAESLEGALLRPEKRQSLLRLGRVMGLRPFDCNLVIAIVQDQVRRGYAPQVCVQQGAKQLTMVPVASVRSPAQRRVSWAITIVSLVVMEAFMLWWWWGQ